MKSLFFCPVFNQIEEFPALLEEIKSTKLPCDTLLLINSGSSDGSEKLVRESGLPYIDLERNLGVGYTFIRALDWALERDYDLFGSIASNGKMLPSEMSGILDPLLKGEADYVTGSRFLEGGDSPNLPGFRKYSIPMVNYYIWLVTGRKLTDCTCGYRAFRLDVIRRAMFDWHRESLYTYGFESYLYAKVLLSNNVHWKEVPITMKYPKKGKRYSKIRPGKDWYVILKPWVMARLDRKGFRDK